MVKKIAITGGPCSGKTTALAYLSERLLDFGYRVFIVPEIPTQIISGGVPDINTIAVSSPALYLEVERTIFLLYGDYERHIGRLANLFSADEKALMIIDRGRPDVFSYVDALSKERILKSASGEDTNEHGVRESYDAAIHMVTAAKGAEAFYTLTNNRARRESFEEARDADDRTLRAWQDHSHLSVIDNYHSRDFEHKLRRLLQAILHVLGIPEPVEMERKYLVTCVPRPNIPELAGTRTSTIEQIYLTSSSDEEVRVRKRSFDDFTLYFETRKRAISTGVRAETERRISAEEYAVLAKNQDPNTRVIRKTRRCFIYHDRRFELDTFFYPPGISILEVELADMDEKIKLPPFLDIMREVTDNPHYSNHSLAQKY